MKKFWFKKIISFCLVFTLAVGCIPIMTIDTYAARNNVDDSKLDGFCNNFKAEILDGLNHSNQTMAQLSYESSDSYYNKISESILKYTEQKPYNTYTYNPEERFILTFVDGYYVEKNKGNLFFRAADLYYDDDLCIKKNEVYVIFDTTLDYGLWVKNVENEPIDTIVDTGTTGLMSDDSCIAGDDDDGLSDYNTFAGLADILNDTQYKDTSKRLFFLLQGEGAGDDIPIFPYSTSDNFKKFFEETHDGDWAEWVVGQLEDKPARYENLIRNNLFGGVWLEQEDDKIDSRDIRIGITIDQQNQDGLLENDPKINATYHAEVASSTDDTLISSETDGDVHGIVVQGDFSSWSRLISWVQDNETFDNSEETSNQDLGFKKIFDLFLKLTKDTQDASKLSNESGLTITDKYAEYSMQTTNYAYELLQLVSKLALTVYPKDQEILNKKIKIVSAPNMESARKACGCADTLQGDCNFDWSHDTFVENLFNQLTPYQKDSLLTVNSKYLASTNMTINNIPSSCKILFTNKNITDNSTGSDNVSIDGLASLKDLLLQRLTEFRNQQYITSDTPFDNARWADVVGVYALYHALLQQAGTTTYESSVYNAVDLYDKNVESMFNSVWDAYNDKNLEPVNKDQEIYLPLMPASICSSAIGYIKAPDLSAKQFYDANGNNPDKYWNILQSALFTISYGFDIAAKSEYGDIQDFTPQKLRAVLNGTAPADDEDNKKLYDMFSAFLPGVEGSMSQTQIETLATQTDFGEYGDASLKMIRAIIQLHRLCDDIGIKPSQWSDTIAEYYAIYEDFEQQFAALEMNPIVMGIGYSGELSVKNPLGKFFASEDGNHQTSIAWNKGFALSSSYIPFITNVYDIALYDENIINDRDWLIEFFYRYGFYRKALYISQDPDIVVNNAIGKTSNSGTKVCTLEDLLNYDRDIILYIDTNFYNSDIISTALNRTDYTTIRQSIEETQRDYQDKLQQAASAHEEDTAINDELNQNYQYDGNYIDEVLNLSTDSILKTNGMATYSVELARNVTQLGQTEDVSKTIYDAYILSGESIIGKDSVFDLYEYSPMTGYAIISAIYRDYNMFNLANSNHGTKTIMFESSKNIVNNANVSDEKYYPFYNYIALSSLESLMSINTDTKLDLQSPVFIDIFGNIITESGYVIIPAAANATYSQKYWSQYTMAWAYYTKNGIFDSDITHYSKKALEFLTGGASRLTQTGVSTYDTLNETDTIIDENGEAKTVVYTSEDLMNLQEDIKRAPFAIDYGRQELYQKDTVLNAGTTRAIVQWKTINATSETVKTLFFDDAYYNKARKMFNVDSDKIVTLILEVLRGAPLENIDYVKEKINPKSNDKIAIVGAWALDALTNAVEYKEGGVNSTLSMPNVAFMPYLKYVVYFALKIALALLIGVFIFNLFRAGVKNRLGLKYVGKLIFTCVVVASAVYILPMSVSWSYDKANSLLLTAEASDILMYNEVRKQNEQEIGVTEIKPISSNTELYMEVGSAEIDWSKLLSKGLLTNEYASFEDIFEDSKQNSIYTGNKMVDLIGSKYYISCSNILDSTVISYSPGTHALTNSLIAHDSGSDEDYGKVGKTLKIIAGESDGVGQKSTTQGTSESINIIGYNEDSTIAGQEETAKVSDSTRTEMYENSLGTELAENKAVWVPDDTAIYSFVSPYYYFVDQLVANINFYNTTHEITSNTWSVDRNGVVQTYDTASAYLLDTEFMEEGYDLFNLYHICNTTNNLPIHNPVIDTSIVGYSNMGFTAEELSNMSAEDIKNNSMYTVMSDISKMRSSEWYTADNYEEEEISQKISNVYEYTRNYVANHKDVLGKIPDESLIKIIAFVTAVKFNQEFNTMHADSIKLMQVDNQDLFRFMVTDFKGVYMDYPYSFGRFVLNNSSILGIILSALLILVTVLCNFIKPALIVIMFIIIIINIVFRKLLFQKENQGIEGYFIGCALFMAVNLIYALLLKVCFIIPKTNLPVVAAVLITILVQLLYLVAVVILIGIQVKDWRNGGWNKFRSIGSSIANSARNMLHHRHRGPMPPLAPPPLVPAGASMNISVTPEGVQANVQSEYNYGSSRDDMFMRDARRHNATAHYEETASTYNTTSRRHVHRNESVPIVNPVQQQSVPQPQATGRASDLYHSNDRRRTIRQSSIHDTELRDMQQQMSSTPRVKIPESDS